MPPKTSLTNATEHANPAETDHAIAAYRRFTRFYTRILGLLGDKLL